MKQLDTHVHLVHSDCTIKECYMLLLIIISQNILYIILVVLYNVNVLDMLAYIIWVYSGTEKQHVADDYAERLHIGQVECQVIITL